MHERPMIHRPMIHILIQNEAKPRSETPIALVPDATVASGPPANGEEPANGEVRT